MSANPRSQGFTLLEMAIVLIVLAMASSWLLSRLQHSTDFQYYRDTRAEIEKIKTALIGYALTNGRLPCPDSDGDGLQEASCAGAEGFLPWKDLGVGRYDAWKRPFRYRADGSYTGASIPLASNTTTRLCVEDVAGNDLTRPEENNTARVVAVIFSHGKNRVADNRNIAGFAGACSDSNISATYAQDTPRDSFDDVLGWLPKTLLLKSLYSAGKKWEPPLP